MGPFTFKITWYSSFDEKEFTTCGCLFANSYAEAMEKIEYQFKNCLVSVDHLYGMEESDYIELANEEMMKTIEHDN